MRQKYFRIKYRVIDSQRRPSFANAWLSLKQKAGCVAGDSAFGKFWNEIASDPLERALPHVAGLI
jgi:hypothetical protein